jgi:hypothetical protein
MNPFTRMNKQRLKTAIFTTSFAALLIVLANSLNTSDSVPINKSESKSWLAQANDTLQKIGLTQKNTTTVDTQSADSELAKFCGGAIDSVSLWLQSEQPLEAVTEVENLHFINNQGHETRINITYPEGESASKKVARFYNLDADELPQNIPTPAEFLDMEPEKAIEYAKTNFKVIRHLSSGQMTLKNKLNVAYEKSFDKYTSLEISAFSNDLTGKVIVSCEANANCICEKSATN